MHIRSNKCIHYLIGVFVTLWLALLCNVVTAFAGCTDYRIRGLQSHEELLKNGWHYIDEIENTKIYNRKSQDSPIYEVMARGVIDAPPREVFDVVTDYANYSKFMPYTEESKVEERKSNLIWVYERLVFPFISDRHFVVKAQLIPCPGAPAFYVVDWTQANGWKLPDTSSAIVPAVNDGRWELWPIDQGKKTFGSYSLHTDPGGWIPSFLVNLANKRALPDVMTHVRNRVANRQANH